MSIYADPAFDPEFVRAHELRERARSRVIRRDERTARKVYGCWRCGMLSLHVPAEGAAPILPGQRYVREWAYGTLSDHASHVVCPARPEAGA